MELTARPTVTAGVALASAAVLAAGPMAQRLPELRLAQHLPQVSVSDINLTDAAEGMVDLFAGVENELVSFANNGMASAEVPAAGLADVISAAGLPLPLQTWIDTFETAGANLQYIFDEWSKVPFPVAQQLVTNWVQYASVYVGSFQNAANGAVGFFTGTQSFDFWPTADAAFGQLMSGDISGAFDTMHSALFFWPLLLILAPLEKTLTIPIDITDNLYKATDYMLTTGVTQLGNYLFSDMPGQAWNALGNSLQAVYDSWTAGDAVAALSNLVNTPGAMTNGLLNGLTGSYGLLSSPASGSRYGLLYVLATTLAPTLAKEIVAPNAQNVEEGGSISVAIQDFLHQLINGWPSLQTIVGNLANLWDTYGGVGSAAATMAAALSPADLSTGAGVMAGAAVELPSLLQGFDPAAVTDIAGSLGPSLATDLGGALGTTATTLATDFSTIALDILSAL
ncbi:hypothetical protein [Mycobacterium malmoense]|uniref:hypothetical protein n=1 Tax=Mycobacterium malmoense TaxID=1780 RepID=UPI00114D4D8F|nr:hypothetical protein [Mycobacterium malmoense]